VLRLLPAAPTPMRSSSVPQNSQPGPGRRAGPGRRGGPRIRPVLACGPPHLRCPRELPDAPPEAGPARGPDFDAAPRSPAPRSRRHAARHRAGHGRRAEPAACRARPRAAARRLHPPSRCRTARCDSLRSDFRRRLAPNSNGCGCASSKSTQRTSPSVRGCSRAFETVLATLESRGLPWGIVTNKPGWLTDPLLEALDLGRRAACAVSGDTVSERKPHPLPLLHAARLLGVDAETLRLRRRCGARHSRQAGLPE